MNKRGRPNKCNTKNKTFSMRCDQHFLDQVDELRAAFGLNRSELIEFVVKYYSTISGGNDE